MSEFKIKKAVFYPVKRDPILWGKGVYLPASLNNARIKDKKTMTRIIEFILNHCDNFLVVVGDYLHRHNLQLQFGLNESEATDTALKKGQSLIEHITESAEDTGKRDRVSIISCKTFYDRTDFHTRLNKLLVTQQEDEEFAALTRATIKTYLLRNKIHSTISGTKAEDLCKRYLTEELVIFEMLAEDGFKTNVYPGSQLPVMREIVQGALPHVSEILETLRLIEIKFKIQP